MKKYFSLIATVLVFITLTLQGQIHLLKDSLIKKNFKNPNNSGYYIQYSDKTNSVDNLPLPKDNNGQTAELMDTKLNSLEKLEKITQHIFDSNQAKYLAKNKCYFSCIITSTGKILSASIIFNNNDPAVDMKQLVEFSNQIKENLSFELVFNKEIKQTGYISLVHPAFQSLMTPNPLKAKP